VASDDARVNVYKENFPHVQQDNRSPRAAQCRFFKFRKSGYSDDIDTGMN
jgi:hypothetical protein